LNPDEWKLGRRDKRVDVAWLVLAALIGVMPDALSGVLVGDSTVSKAGWTAAAQGRPRPSLGVAMPNYARRLLANSEPPSARRPHYYHLRLGTHPPPRRSGKRLGWPIRKSTPGHPEPFNLAFYSLSLPLLQL
jgi:hypothetical protein